MSELCHSLIGDDSPRLTSEQAFFVNINLDSHVIRDRLLPIIEIICHRIEGTYRSPAKISFTGANANWEKKIINCMQFDDICLKLWHVHSGQNIFLVLSARFARTLLIRLLATSLIDDSNSLPFSSTEKGLFSFVIARLIFDLKAALVDKMPDLKLMGIYHTRDQALPDLDIQGFGIYHFSFTFAADIYPIILALPKKLFDTFKIPNATRPILLARCGHLHRTLVIPLINLAINTERIGGLRLGDLILFDHMEVMIVDKGLYGPLRAYWENVAIMGRLVLQNQAYQFVVTKPSAFHKEDQPMEELEISYANGKDVVDFELQSPSSRLLDLAKNIRVSLSIEVARLPMTLKEISELREGEIIDLHRKIDDPLEMRLDDKVIGHCQPVQIDGRLGIRVIRLEGNKEEDV